MIRKFSYGNPIETEAVVKNMEKSKGDVPYFAMLQTEGEEKTPSFSFNMDDEDIVYGLGENVRGINKRGFLYKSKCSDDPCHQESTNSLYGAHNFIIVSGKQLFGVFVDFPGEVIWDIGYTKLHELVITPKEPDFDIYIIEGDDEKSIVHRSRPKSVPKAGISR